MPAQVTTSFLTELHSGSLPGTTLHADLHQRHYMRLLEMSEKGYGKSFSKITEAGELKLFEGFKRNLSQMAAAKQFTAKEELLKLQGLSLQNFKKESARYMNRLNVDWLEAEAQAARASAQSASKWQGYQRRKYLYPNLKYSTVGDARVRDSHAALNGAIYPVDDVFWDTYMTPNGYRCRCITIMSDKPVNTVDVDWLPDPGMRHNPGKTGVAFDDSHPYFKLGAEERSGLDTKGEKLRADREWPQVKRMALNKFTDSGWKLPNSETVARIDSKGLDQVRNGLEKTTTVEPAIAADLITALDVVIPLLQVGAGEGYFLELLDTTFYFSFTDGVLTKISSL